VTADFAGAAGRRRLVRALGDQTILRGTASGLVDVVADLVDVVVLADGDVLFEQDGVDDDMAFVVSGTVEVRVHGRLVAVRSAGQHVGEMAMLDPAARRSASVIASGPCVVARIFEPNMTALADANPVLWRHIACELGDRLRQRNLLVAKVNAVPHLFVGSSSERYSVAEALAGLLPASAVEVQTWKMSGVFAPSGYTLPDLEVEAAKSDFAVLVLGPDDVVESRKLRQAAPRDNVILELGLFIGACKHERVFLLVEEGTDLKLPTDLVGITQLRYTPVKTGKRSKLGKSKRTSTSKPAVPDLTAAVASILAVVDKEGAR
jgi:predicted nucleotide-binding protein